MVSKQSTVDFLTDQIHTAGIIHNRKMFGEYAIYCDGKVVALVCDDHMYVKITEPGKTFLDESHEAPPYPGAKNYFRIPEDRWDDAAWLTTFIRQTAAALPTPKPKKKKKSL
ncbi:MAG TPA: TfoX/Sxy family protein [Candidatus Saccharimonadales bacterium]|nr:TfoX/Sxy family protein [Candidatus Saccharimonadales bacterium]